MDNANYHDSRTQRFRELALNYEAAPHYGDDAFLSQYAKERRKDFLRARQEILHEHRTFHHDPYFIAYLKAVAPHLLQWATWRTRALQIAERLDVAAKPKLSEEERLAKIEHFRARMLTRQRVQAEDQMAKLAQRLSLRSQIRAMLDETNELDEDEKEQLLREFEDTLETPEEDTNGQYKKF